MIIYVETKYDSQYRNSYKKKNIYITYHEVNHVKTDEQLLSEKRINYCRNSLPVFDKVMLLSLTSCITVSLELGYGLLPISSYDLGI